MNKTYIPFTYSINKQTGKVTRLTVTIDGRAHPVADDNKYFNDIFEALKVNDGDTVKRLVNIKNAIVTFTEGRVSIINGNICLDGVELANPLTARMMEMLTAGFDITPISRFLAKCAENPNQSAINELYDFLEVCDLPITEDGDFLAYKVVNPVFLDYHTRTVNYSPGESPSMSRNACDANRHETCSTGLHFCSRSYIACYSSEQGARLIELKINPANVTAIPTDYNMAKGRACKVYVTREVVEGNIPANFAPDDTTPATGRGLFDRTKVTDEDIESVVDEDDYNDDAPVRLPASTKLVEHDVYEIRKLLTNGWKPSVIAARYDVHRRTIERIASGQAWKHLV